MKQQQALDFSRTPLQGVFRLSLIITIILFAYILTFLHKLERTGCDCARDWRRSFIIFHCIYMIVLSASQFVGITTFHLMMAPVSFGLGLLFVVFTLQYVHRLKREKCSCSAELGRSVLYIVAAIDAAVFAVIGLMIVIYTIIALSRSMSA